MKAVVVRHAVCRDLLTSYLRGHVRWVMERSVFVKVAKGYMYGLLSIHISLGRPKGLEQKGTTS